MSDEVVVRPYEPGDESGIVELLEMAFGGWPNDRLSCSSPDHWMWKYRDDDVRKNLIGLALHNDEVVGVKHTVPIKIKVFDRTLLCGIGSDVAVHPKMRKTGIRDNITTLIDDMRREYGVKYNYNVTSNPVVVKIMSRTQKPFPIPLMNLTRIRDIDEQLRKMPMKNAWLMKLGYHGTKFLNEIGNLMKRSEPSDDSINIVEITNFDDRVDDFWEEISRYYDFIVERRMKHLNWRYCDPRGGNFVVKQAEDEEGNIIGYCVLGTNEYMQDYPIGYVVDLVTPPDRSDAANLLVEDAVRFFDGRKVNIVNSLVVKDHPHMNVFRRHGFLNSRIEPRMFYYPLEDVEQFEELKNVPPRRIHFSYGDIDTLPAKMPGYV